MKLKKGDEVYPFITGDDVIVTKGTKHPGKTFDVALEEIDDELTSQKKDIEKLKSNLKYLYSYGGVGGNGNNGSGGSTGAAVLFISLGGHQLQNGGNPIVLNEPGTYVLEGNVSNSGGETYYVSVTVGNREIPIPALSIEKNKCRFSTSVNLPRNGEVSVMFYGPDGETALSAIRQNYIVNPHTFNVKFKYEFESGGNTQEAEFDSSNEYFIGDNSHKNPFVDISFKIDIPNVTNVSVEYSIGDTDEITDEESEYISGQGIKQFGDTTDISNNHFKIHLDKLKRNEKKFTDESNTGTYDVSVILKYTANAETVTSTSTFKITLIPNYLYINVRNPQNLLYDTFEDILKAINDGEEGIPKRSLNVGVYTSFYCKIYEGTIRTNRQQYPLTFKSYDMYDDDGNPETPDVFKDDPSITENRTGIVEQVETARPISVAFETPGIKKLEFVTLGQKTTVHDNEKPVVKYIYVKESESNIDWYPTSLQQQTFYFRANSGENTFSPNFPTSAFSGTSPLELSETSRPITLSDELWGHPNTGYDTTIISFGIQYSAVNNDGAEIFRTYEGSSNVPDIVLHSNKLFSDTGKKICIPTENNFDKSVNEQYHLVQIVRYKIGWDSSNSPQYASYLYIDGKLESNKPGTDSNQLFIGRIVLNNVNVVYNLISIQYIKLDEPSVVASNESSTIDALVYQYYLGYKDIMHVGIVSEAEKEILKTISDIKFDGENVIVEKSFIDSTSPYMPIPTMMMEYEGQKLDDGTPDITDLNKFISDLFRGYPNGDTAFGRREISLYWCEGKKEGTKTSLNKIEIPTITDSKTNISYTGNWMVELQGTSTMRNRIKNFSLVVNTRNTTGDKVLLMSPNFDRNNPKTFLPESVWTIKADIADSAHANNTSIGKFVNEVCTPFSQSNGMNLSGNVAAYVKNTLEGFPVLMYFKIGEAVYYLGVYNFNMGRQSYYNLGYHTSTDMTEMMTNIIASGDSPFSFSIGSGEIVSTLAIGEIQDNFAEFDFHQFDDSVLFQPDDSSITRMFGKDSKITGADKGRAKGTLSNFVKSVSRAGAYCFASIGKTPVKSKADDSDKCINRYDVESYKDEENKTHFIEKVPDISWQMRYSGTDRIWTEDTSISFTNIGRDIDNLLKCIHTFDKNDNQISPFLDFSSASEYYTICMAFGMVDSILKNMNIKSWDGHKCYVAFYDMDCALEENNAGGEDVSYLAATDYWHSEFSRGYVEPVTVNYDYWNSEIGKGFDFSSSYLFAIAKYAQAIFNKLDGNKITLTNFPQQFWAKLRQPKTKTSNGGALRDANYFINTYFSSGIGKIPAYLASLNYQVKYLYKGTIIDDQGRETEIRPLANESAFNGTRLEKVKDWLNKRLHFLDVVFNVQGIGLPIGGGYTTPNADSNLLSDLSQNNDIIVLSDMFSTENAKTIIMGSNALPVDVYAPMNTPFIINRGSSNEIYLLCAGTDEPNPISITATESESYRFLGSKEFTKLSMIEPFLTSAYMINSNKIEEIIYGGMTVPAKAASFNIVSTSVKKILFNIPTFSGTLSINSTGLNGQAVHTLDISRTGFSCDLRSLSNLKTLNIASINNRSGFITVAECPIIGENCTISGIEGYNPTTLNTLTMSGVSGKFDIRDTNIENINFTIDPDKEGEISINGDTILRNLNLNGFKKIAIRNCPNLEKLVIESPEKCIELIIDIPDTNERLYTLNGFNNIYNKYNPETELEEEVTYPGVFDFTSFINLETLSLSGSEGVVIKIPNRKVSILTFRDNKKLEFIDTAEENSVIELTQDSTFLNCWCYGMRQSWWSDERGTSTRPTTYPISDLIGDGQKGVGNLTKMCVSETCESLANTFYKSINTFPTKYPISKPYRNVWGQDVYNSVLTQSEAKEFINSYVGGVKIEEEHIIEREKNIYDISGKNKQYGEDCRANIKSLYGCFYNQKGIFYKGNPDSDIPDLSGYTSLTNISMMYYGTGVEFLNSNVLSLPDENNTNDGELLQMDNILGFVELKISKDAFKHISYRINTLTNMILSIYGEGYDYNQLLNTDVDTDGYLNIVDILCPKLKEDAENETDYEPFTRITSFNNFSVKANQWIDYSDLLKMCPEVKSLVNFLNCDLSKSKIDGMMKDCKNLEVIDMSFNHTGGVEFLEGNSSHAIDLYEFFNWNESSLYTKITNLFTSISSGSSTPVGFSVKKEISNEHFLEIMGLLHNYENISKLSNLFSYCTINGYDGSEIKLEGDMNNVVNINSLFYKCKSSNNTPLKIRRSFFEHLKNVTLMANTFYGVWFDHMLSYDFFCKQLPTNEATIENVYLDSEGHIPGILKTVKYRNSLINDMSYCFCEAKFVGCDDWFNPADVVNNNLIPFDDIVNDDSTIKEYYKLAGGVYVKYVISENSAYSDTRNNFTNYVDNVRISGLQESWYLNNHNIEADLKAYKNKVVSAGPYTENTYKIYPTYCCLPPDIFYGCANDCNLSNVFADTNIIGVIPQHLLKKCYNSKLEDMFRNVNILPNLIYHYNKNTNDSGYLSLINDIEIDEDTISIKTSTDDKIVCVFDAGDATVLFRNSNGELKRRRPISYVYLKDDSEHTPITNDNRYKDFNKSQFVYVPQGYTTNQNLNGAFTFRYNLPAQIDLSESSLASEDITWAAGNYDTSYSPEELHPELWPYYTQYYFMTDESISWNRLIYMSHPFISDSQDVDLVPKENGTREIRVFSSGDSTYKNKWWSNYEDVIPSRWDGQTYGLLNVFLNLCCKRDIRTGKLSDNGCTISKSMTNTPQIGSFISGTLVTLLNGKVFDDGMDAGRLTNLNASSNIIQYSIGFGRNIILPKIQYTMSDISQHPKILLTYNSDNVLFYEYMFPQDSLNKYKSIYNMNNDKIKSGNFKYIVK